MTFFYWVLFIAPLVALYGCRGGTFHKGRLLWVFPVVAVMAKLLLNMEWSLLLFFTVLWSVPIGTVVGLIGEPFYRERFTLEGFIGEWAVLGANWSRMSACLAVVLVAAFCAYPPSLVAIFRLFTSFMMLLVVVVVVAVGIYFLLSRMKPSVEKDAIDHLASNKNQAAAKAAAGHDNGVLAGSIDGQPLYVSIEDRASVIGPPGTGKTAFLVSQLLDWCESGRSFVCTDIKPEIYGIVRQRLKAQGYTLYAYNPTQSAGHRYNLLQDVEGPEQIGELAAALIPSPDPENAVFNESARDFLDAIISHLRFTRKDVSLTDVRAFVTEFEDYKSLFKALRKSGCPDVQDLVGGLRLAASNERLLGSIFATFRSNLRFLRYPAIRKSLAASDFSLSELSRGKVGIFLQFEEANKELTANLASVLIGHLLRYLTLHTAREPVLLLLDEIGTMPVIVGLKEKLNTIRSRNIPTWLYWQSKEQMQAYGQKTDEGPNIILGACDMQMVFRLNDNASANWFSEKMGTVDRLVEKTTTSGGLFGDVSYSEDLVTEPLIRPHELQQLDLSEVVCMYRGKAWRGKAVPYYDRWPEYRGKKPVASDCIGKAYRQEEVLNGTA